MSTKDRILKHLKDKKGQWISGESLSTELQISRSAIWKYMTKFKEEGYEIESISRKGYQLKRISPLLLPNEIREGLKTQTFGQKDIFHYTQINSTNSKAKELAVSGSPEGTLVVSEKQLKGRGRKGRHWFSPTRGGIYLSQILRPAMLPSEAPKITLLTAVALAESLRSITKLDVKIKWPNDILFNRKKIAGILTEISAETDVVNYIIVGLGLNVNIRQFPEELSEQSTSIFIETGKLYSRKKLVRSYLTRFETHYDTFKRRGFAAILKRWKGLTNIIGKNVRVETLGPSYAGVVQDIDAEGVLLLKDNNGNLHRILAGDVILI